MEFDRDANKNLLHLLETYQSKMYTGAVLEGGSRSGKSWSTIDFFIWLCSEVETDSTIHVLRETYASFKTSLFEDFKRRLPDYGIVDHPFGTIENISKYKLFGNTFHFLSSDNPSKSLGAGADYVWFNELLEISKAVFDQKEQRCRKFWIGDYNPSYYDHWVYESIFKRKDVNYLHTTVFDNPHVSDNEKKKILSYEPTNENKKSGTHDPFMWSVYGLGKRAALSGLVFRNWNKTELDPDVGEWYGLDFGYTNDPAALIQVKLFDGELYLKELIYSTGLTNRDLADRLRSLGIDYRSAIYADSAEPKSIDELIGMGFNVIPAEKGKDSIVNGINVLKQYKINVDSGSLNLIKELNNYKFETDRNGRTLNKPVDAFNHLIDAVRYAVTMRLRQRKVEKRAAYTPQRNNRF